ncbi:MAG: hypothetical protein RSD09_04240 [Bacilli bacterium]
MNCKKDEDYERIKKKIEESNKCLPKFICCPGPKGDSGNMSNTTTCYCVRQLKKVIEQLIILYPNKMCKVTTEYGTILNGKLGSLIPASNPNLLQLVNGSGALDEVISLCKIASIEVNGAQYNETITYLPNPTQSLIGCDTNCYEAFKNYLPVGTAKAVLKAGSKPIAMGKVLKNVYGMVVIVLANNENPTFVSLCKVESAKIN